MTEQEREEVLTKMRRGAAILFSPDSDSLAPLMHQLGRCGKRCVVLWALERGEEACERFREMFPREEIPHLTVDLSRQWARGEILLPEARRSILDCHALAKSMDDREGVALVHAIGQACSTVHAQGHARAYPLYRLTAIIRRYGESGGWEEVEQEVLWLQSRLNYWIMKADDPSYSWAPHLLASDPLNST